MAKDTGSSIAELFNLIGSSLDSWFTGGTLGDIEGSITNWNENTRRNYGTPVEATKVNYLYDLISDGLAAAQADDEMKLSKIATKLGKIDSEILTSVPGLQQQVNKLRNKIDQEYNNQVTRNILKQSKRQAAEDSARQYGNLTDRERAMAADPKSKAAKQIADFNKKAMDAGLIDKPVALTPEGNSQAYAGNQPAALPVEKKALLNSPSRLKDLVKQPGIRLQTTPDKELTRDEIYKVFHPEK